MESHKRRGRHSSFPQVKQGVVGSVNRYDGEFVGNVSVGERDITRDGDSFSAMLSRIRTALQELNKQTGESWMSDARPVALRFNSLIRGGEDTATPIVLMRGRAEKEGFSAESVNPKLGIRAYGETFERLIDAVVRSTDKAVGEGREDVVFPENPRIALDLTVKV